MARRYYSSTAARTTLASGVDDSTTTFSVTAVSGWPASYPYTLVIDQDTVNEELVEVSARSGTTLTVTRGVDGTSAVAHDSGAAVNHGVSARDFDEPNEFINGTGVVTESMLASNAVTSAKILDGTIVNADINASAAIAQSKIADLTSDLASKVDYALPVNAQTGTTYTFVAADAEKLTTASNAAAVTLTIPPQSSVTWSDNTVLRVVNYGAGAVTIDGGSGVTVTNTSSTIAQYGAAVAIRTGSDAWTVVPFGGGDIPAATVSSPAATGQYTDTGITYDYYTFTSSGTLTVDTAGFADILVIGGGGGGGEGGGAGGGAGGHLYAADVYLPSGTLTVTVGAGGAAGNDGDDSGSSGVSGAASRLGDFLFSPGGGAGAGISRDGSGNFVGQAGQAGGSGGGSSVYEVGSAAASGAGVTTLGNNGGIGSGTSLRGAGGGGGAGAAGSNASGTTGGNGGAGTANSITGSSVTRAGGGGGSGASVAGSGGTGGGGGGTINSAGTGGSGTANTGGGGGGAYRPTDAGGAGGSGVVIVRVKV